MIWFHLGGFQNMIRSEPKQIVRLKVAFSIIVFFCQSNRQGRIIKGSCLINKIFRESFCDLLFIRNPFFTYIWNKISIKIIELFIQILVFVYALRFISSSPFASTGLSDRAVLMFEDLSCTLPLKIRVTLSALISMKSCTALRA